MALDQEIYVRIVAGQLRAEMVSLVRGARARKRGRPLPRGVTGSTPGFEPGNPRSIRGGAVTFPIGFSLRGGGGRAQPSRTRAEKGGQSRKRVKQKKQAEKGVTLIFLFLGVEKVMLMFCVRW